MYVIRKLVSHSAVDYAAEELKKYLRMMMPECGRIDIKYDPYATDGFRLGLMQDMGLDVSGAEDTALDDILYIDTDIEGPALFFCLYFYLHLKMNSHAIFLRKA